jgi:CHASE1-domain containing sensor protein
VNLLGTELAGAGFSNPTIRNFDDKPLDKRALDGPVDVLMDLEPRDAETNAFAGRVLDQSPTIGPMLARAKAEGKPVASDPLNLSLMQDGGPVGLVLAAPVVPDGATEPAGFVTFSYELVPLMLTNGDFSLFRVALKDPRSPDSELIENEREPGVTSHRATRDDPAPTAVRIVSFGNRDWHLNYYARDTANRAQQSAMITGTMIIILGALLLGIVVSWMR